MGELYHFGTVFSKCVKEFYGITKYERPCEKDTNDLRSAGEKKHRFLSNASESHREHDGRFRQTRYKGIKNRVHPKYQRALALRTAGFLCPSAARVCQLCGRPARHLGVLRYRKIVVYFDASCRIPNDPVLVHRRPN